MLISRFIFICYVLVTGFVAIFLWSPVSWAQSAVIVVDQSYILKKSEVGQHIERQVASIGEAMKKEWLEVDKPIKEEENKLAEEIEQQLKVLNPVGELSPAKLQQDRQIILERRPDLLKRAQVVQYNNYKQQNDAAYKEQELKVTAQKAFSHVTKKMNELIDTLAVERGANIVLDKSQVVYVDVGVDITDEVLSRLNAVMTTVPVIRERLPRQKKPNQIQGLDNVVQLEK